MPTSTAESRAAILDVTLGEQVRCLVQPAPHVKTISVLCCLHRHLAEKPTYTALLPNVLRRGTVRYPTLRHLASQLESMYGAALAADAVKRGEQHLLCLRLNIVADRYLPRDRRLLPKGLALLEEVLLNPCTEALGFNPRYVETEKRNLRQTIKALVNDPLEYASERCYQELCREEAYAIHEFGRLEDLPAITSSSLYQDYLTLRSSCPLYFLVYGNVKPDKVVSLLQRLPWPREKEIRRPPETVVRSASGKPPLRLVETARVQQAKLVLGFRTGIVRSDPRYYAMQFVHGLLGAFSHSRLFRRVREEEGLAYLINSIPDHMKGTLQIIAGVDARNVARTVSLIEEELQDIREGRLTSREVSETRRCLRDGVRAALDSPAWILGKLLQGLLTGRIIPPEEEEQGLLEVTEQDIRAVAERLRLELAYVLAPEGTQDVELPGTQPIEPGQRGKL